MEDCFQRSTYIQLYDCWACEASEPSVSIICSPKKVPCEIAQIALDGHCRSHVGQLGNSPAPSLHMKNGTVDSNGAFMHKLKCAKASHDLEPCSCRIPDYAEGFAHTGA